VSKKTKYKVPLSRSVYAFTKHRKGDFLLFIKEHTEFFQFMQLPDRYQVNLTKKEFHEGVTTKLLDFVEQIPEDVFEVARANIETYQKIS